MGAKSHSRTCVKGERPQVDDDGDDDDGDDDGDDDCGDEDEEEDYSNEDREDDNGIIVTRFIIIQKLK